MSLHYWALAFCIITLPFAQLLLKLGSHKEDAFISSFFRPLLLSGLFLFFIVSVISVFSFQVVPLKISSAWTSLSFVIVTLLSRFFLKEKFTTSRWVGCFFIFLGIFIFHQ